MMRTTLNATQRSAGADIRWAGTSAFTGDDTFSATGLGVTTTATKPTTMANLAHFVEATFLGEDVVANWQKETDVYRIQNGVQLDYTSRLEWRGYPLELDSNFVAGRYLWFLMINGPAETSSTPIEACSTSYHIR
jgi:hypothetical protein